MSLFGVSSSCIGLQPVTMAFPSHIHILFIKKVHLTFFFRCNGGYGRGSSGGILCSSCSGNVLLLPETGRGLPAKEV